MSFASNPQAPSETKPFVIEHQKHDLQPSGQFVPGVRLLVTAILRTSGLLTDLPDAEAKIRSVYRKQDTLFGLAGWSAPKEKEGWRDDQKRGPS